MHNRVEVTGLRPSPLPHHRTCGFDSVPPTMRSGFAGLSEPLSRQGQSHLRNPLFLPPTVG
jgi:hypothetical protein